MNKIVPALSANFLMWIFYLPTGVSEEGDGSDRPEPLSHRNWNCHFKLEPELARVSQAELDLYEKLRKIYQSWSIHIYMF